MKIAILGTRGIPNNYGGFEQFAEYISVGLVEKGHDVTVYNPHFHPYQDDNFNGVKIRRCYSPEHLMGAAANFIYDYLCLKDALAQDFDIIYEAGYHSNAPSYSLFKNKKYPILITNMDGLEWKRSKWNKATRMLIKYLEKLAVKKSHYLIADNVGIQQYYQDTFGVNPFFIAYGANRVDCFLENAIHHYSVKKNQYYMLIARIEPENNIEVVLDGYIASGSAYPFLVVGNCKNKFGTYLMEKFKNTHIRFIGPVYDIAVLDNLRHFSRAYFHGHSVGGTNPSLLEAMASSCLIVAHDNPFNKSVLKEGALYFESAEKVADLINSDKLSDNQLRSNMIELNLQEIANNYNWERIVDQHDELFRQLLSNLKK